MAESAQNQNVGDIRTYLTSAMPPKLTFEYIHPRRSHIKNGSSVPRRARVSASYINPRTTRI